MPAHETLSLWESFYVIVGSSAAALTGLQFVVIALVTESPRKGGTREIDAFATPTVVHFCFVLLVSAILSAPWPRLEMAALTLALAGLVGLVYSVIIWRRATRTEKYKPVLEDWLFHVWLPLVAYAALHVSAWSLLRSAAMALFVVAGSALLLLFIGIHNAWDTATWIMLSAAREQEREPSSDAQDASRAPSAALAASAAPPISAPQTPARPEAKNITG